MSSAFWVYEFMPRGSLENHLFSRGSYFQPLSWTLRMKVALGAAKGLAFLHSAETRMIYRDFKTSNILLDSNYNAKLSDFGLAKDGPTGDKSHVSTRVIGTYGYAAPEYLATEDHVHLSPYLSYISGALAGCAATVGSYPFDLLRTLLASQGEPKVYPTMRSALVDIVKTRGFRGLYAGLSPTLVEIVPYAGLQFGTYDTFKRWTMITLEDKMLWNNMCIGL